MRTEKTACILCSRNCGLTVEIESNNFVRIRGDDDHPVSKGYICQKAARLQHYQQNQDRLQHPLRREPDGSFVRVSWDEALSDIARRLVKIRDQHGGEAFASVGGGGQGNHMGGAYLGQLRAAMKSRYNYNSLGQEKTGDFWVNGRLFGSQMCHTTEDVEHADYVIFLGCNPYHAHGIPNARDTLRDLKKDATRTMVVIDPRLTETARQADIHLQLKPGTDAWLLSAMLAIIARDGLLDREFLARHCTGVEDIEQMLRTIPIAVYAERTGVALADIERVAHGYARARSACLRVDLGIQHTLNSTLNSYFEKLLFLLTGNFGIKGGNNLHSFLIPILGNTDETRKRLKRTAHHNMFPVAGILPPSILPDEILLAGEKRIRAIFVDSANPLVTWPDTPAFEKAFASLELLVVVDVAMTETARMAHYVLPAASQFEKWEFTGFNLEFPHNAFHLRHPLFEPLGETLSEPEIYTRLLEAMGAIPDDFPVLKRISRWEPESAAYLASLAAFAATLAANKKWAPYAASILYRTLGEALPDKAAAAAFLLPLSMAFAMRQPKAVRRAGHKGNRLTLGANLFRAILESRSGVMFSVHEFEEVWSLIANRDKRIHLHIPELMSLWQKLPVAPDVSSEYPFILAAGERRAYNANQIYRSPAWRKTDAHGALRIHPLDAADLGVGKGENLVCESEVGEITAIVEIDEGMQRGFVSLPHGYGMRYNGGDPAGPEINRLTTLAHRDPLMHTPYHKYVPVRLRKPESEAIAKSA